MDGFTSTSLLGELAHRLMVIEAGTLPSLKAGKVLGHLKQQPTLVQQLSDFQRAIDTVLQSKIQILTIPVVLVSAAVRLSKLHGLLTNDGLVVALIQHHNLTDLASHDTDFDRVPGITRYAPA